MRIIKSIILGTVALGAILDAQNIISQFSVQYALDQSLPYFEGAQFATPDSSGGLFFFNAADGSLHRFDAAGKELWSASFSFGSLQGAISTMAVAADGVYLGGQVNGALPGQTNAGSYDAFVTKYDLNGKSLWTAEFGTADSEFVQTIAVAPDGVYILGSSGGPTHLFIRRSDSNGTEIWTRRFTDPALIEILGGAADSTGVSFFGMANYGVVNGVGYNLIRKFDSAGNDLWTHQLDRFAIVTSLATDNQGAYVQFFSDSGSGATEVRRLDLTGSEIWTRTIATTFASGPIAADGTSFYVSSTIDGALPQQCYAGQGDVFLMRFDANSNPIWTREFGTAGPERPAEISIGSEGAYVSWFGAAGNVLVTAIEKSSPPPTGSEPRILNECVLNAANYLGGGVAPGEIVTILGSALGPMDLVKLQPAANGQIPTSLAGVRILFDGEPAPLVYVSGQQSSAIVPNDVAGKSNVRVQVEYNGVQSSAVAVPVFDSRLGVFSFGPGGTGQAAVINEDGTVNSSFNPAAPGSNISIYATGGGLAKPADVDNQITGPNPSPFPTSVYVRLDSDGSCDAPYFEAQVMYYGGAPQSVPGLVQINAQLPFDVPVGDAVPLYLGLYPNATVEQTVTIAIR
ncbi:MAG TPA: PQQ-binding-like beta-propeller repeat protein [Bryobacteraceae bacterium]